MQYEQCFVKSFGWYDGPESIFITMEYLPHGDLQRYLGSPLKESEVQLIVHQTLEGLVFMHKNGFTHRDLKPANILVVCKGPEWWVKIADFGISKRAREGQTALRTLTGTPAFAAPELLGFIHLDNLSDHDDSYTNAVDVWSLGVITFFMLTRQILFRDQRVLGQYTAGRFLFPLGVLQEHEVSEQGCVFVQDLMSCKPEDRPAAKHCLQSSWLLAIEDHATSETHIDCILEASDASDEVENLLHTTPEPSARWSTTSRISDAPQTFPSDSLLEPSAQWSTSSHTLRQNFRPARASSPYQEQLGYASNRNPVDLEAPQNDQSSFPSRGYRRSDTARKSIETLLRKGDSVSGSETKKGEKDGDSTDLEGESSDEQQLGPPFPPLKDIEAATSTIRPSTRRPPNLMYRNSRVKSSEGLRHDAELRSSLPRETKEEVTEEGPIRKESAVAGLLHRFEAQHLLHEQSREAKVSDEIDTKLANPRIDRREELMSPTMMEDWGNKGHAVTTNDVRMQHHDQVHIGAGKYLNQSDIMEIARRRVQPTLDHIDWKAERQRAKEEEAKLDQKERNREARSEKQRQADLKPVFLKGLFSVSTTSSKPVPVIRADIMRVLEKLDVHYTELKHGFTCSCYNNSNQPYVVDVHFEILLVKVPLLSLHGIQFKKLGGDMSLYKDIAQKILKALKL